MSVQRDGRSGRRGDDGEEVGEGNHVVACKGPGGAGRGAADGDGGEYADAEDLKGREGFELKMERREGHTKEPLEEIGVHFMIRQFGGKLTIPNPPDLEPMINVNITPIGCPPDTVFTFESVT